MRKRSSKEIEQVNTEDDRVLLENFIKIHYIDLWKKRNGDSPLCELIFTPVCNTKCSYCYYKNFGEELNPPSLCSKDNLTDNLDTYLSFLKARGSIPEVIDIFSGEFFNIPYWKDLLSIIRKYCPESIITIPTNATFCFDEGRLLEIQDYLDADPKVRLSLSVDGKYLDNDSRPTRSGQKYDDSYYDRLFRFGARYDFKYHPMISRVNIELWKKNYEWFIDNIAYYYGFSKFEALDYVYLLEVRNPDWTTEEIRHFSNFIKWYIPYTYSIVGDPEIYTSEFIFGGSNLLRSIVPISSRGLGCSLQSAFAVRISDLTVVPCHRTSYKGLNAGRLILEKNSPEFHIELENPISYMMTKSFTAINGAKCYSCDVKHLCVKYCVGVNYEVNKDLFIPVDQVCLLEKIKIDSIIQGFDSIGITDRVTNLLSPQAAYEYVNRRNFINDL